MQGGKWNRIFALSAKIEHMKTKRLLAAALLSVCLLSQINTIGQTRVSIETDPSTFLLSGYAIHLRIQPANCERWLIGAGSYGLELPEMLVNLNSKNRNEGWNAKIRNAYSLFGEYFFHRANQKWFVGEQIGLHNYRLGNRLEGGAASDFSSMLAMTYVGYAWHPFKGSFYVKPWAGLGYTRKISGDNLVGTRVYDVAPLFPFVTFHLGYEF
jgi:hypothetical protein